MDTSQSTFGNFQIEDVLEILVRRRLWIAAGAALGLVLGVAAWQLLPPLYTASTTMLVEPQGVPDSFIRTTITLELQARITTLRQRVTSHDNLNTLIDRIGVERLDPGGEHTRESLMGEIRSNLEVGIEGSRVSAAAVVEISYQGADPQVAAEIVGGIAELYIAENRKDRTQQATSTAQFLDQELTRLREDVQDREARIREFNAEHLGALPSQLDSNLAELERLNASLAANLQAQETLRHQMTVVAQSYSRGETDLGAELAEARADLIDLRRRYTDEHPNVTAVASQVAELERQLMEESSAPELESAPLSPMARRETSDLRVGLRARQIEERNLRSRLALVQARVDETPTNEAELAALTRDFENLTATYSKLVSNRQDAALAKNLESAQMAERFKVLRPPAIPTQPIWPHPLLIPAGMALGLALVALLILGVELRSPAFHSVSRLSDQLGLPVFASIPELDPDQFGDVQARRIDWKVVVHTAPESVAAEQYRGFLPFFLESQGCRTVLVTSAGAGDGKSLTCLNLACTLAQDLDRRVLVIDADMRRASMHNLVGAKRSPGLSDVLTGDAELSDCIVDPLPNVSMLTAGSSVRRIVALLTGDAFAKLIQRAQEDFDVVLIDSPPILPVIDTRVLRNLADRVVFVVRAGVSPPMGVMRSLGELKDVAGLVFNRVSPSSFKRYYTYDAYSSYGPPETDGAPPGSSQVVPLHKSSAPGGRIG